MKEVFRGHLDECIQHLSELFLQTYPRGSKEAATAKRPMAKFCKVTIDSVTRWLYRTASLPVGEARIRLMCFLEVNGYRVLEMERMSVRHRNFAMLIGYGLLDADKAAEMLGYGHTSLLYQIFRGDHGPSEDKDQKMWDIWKGRKDQLDEAMEQAGKKFRIPLAGPENHGPIHQEPPASTSANSPASSGCPRDGVVNIMEGLLKFLDSGVLENLTPEDWVTLRKSGSTVLRLSSHLSTLSAKLVKPS